MSDDKNTRELIRKVSTLVDQRHGGSYEAAFRAYASKRTSAPTVDEDELKDMLYDANVGNSLTRGAWASGIIQRLDKDGDGRISWSEFQEGVMRK